MIQSHVYLKKKLIKEGTILGIVVVVMALGALLLQNFADDAQTEQQTTQNELNTERAKLADLRKELENGHNQVSLHDAFSKSHNGNFTLNIEDLSKWFAKQKDVYHLGQMAVNVQPATSITKDTFPLKSGVLNVFEVKITIPALTDNSVFAFIEKMQRDIPGVVVIQDIKISRTQDLSSSVLLGLNQHRMTPLVTADIAFTWIGIRNDVKGVDAK